MGRGDLGDSQPMGVARLRLLQKRGVSRYAGSRRLRWLADLVAGTGIRGSSGHVAIRAHLVHQSS